jgi:MotA/TolQ/ExbB proton channel family protein
MNIFLNKPSRIVVLILSVVIAVVFIGLMTAILVPGSMPAILLLDRPSIIFPYPFTIQNAMHILFFIGLGELFLRWRSGVFENSYLMQGYLPEDDKVILKAHDLSPIRLRVAKEFDGDTGIFPFLIDICILQFQSSRSTDQVVSVLNSNLELITHRLDLNYSMLRYIIWVIPTVGFIGTVVGIAWTLKLVDPENPDLGQLTASLAVAFNTTLIALILSAILVFMLHVVQRMEEKTINLAGHSCLKNLVNRLYAGD